MKPAIQGLTLCLVDTKPPYVAVGDIVTFNRARSFALIQHRVIYIDCRGRIFIKGDNAPEIDIVEFEDIVFKLIKAVRLI